MPYIAFEAGQLEPGIRASLIARLTEVSAELTGIPQELFFVSIRELPDDSIAIGGKTVAGMKRELAGKHGVFDALEKPASPSQSGQTA